MTDPSKVLTAVLEWRSHHRKNAKIASKNYFHHSPETKAWYLASNKQLKKLAKRMNELLDQYEKENK